LIEEAVVATADLTTLVLAYEDAAVAQSDYVDLGGAHREGRVGEYEAAVVRKADAGHELLATTVDPRARWTFRALGLGCVAGAIIAPAFAGVLLGAVFGAATGGLVDQMDAFNHADMREVERLVGDSNANLIVVADAANIDAIAKVAQSRGRRIVVPFSPADVDLLKREVQRAQPPSGPA
jgi:uncharacterized membrane protein